MTIQEAIDYLLDPIGKRERHDEAIRMAVDALKAQLPGENMTSNFISIQDAIDAAIEAVDEWDGGYNLEREDMITDAINNRMQSVWRKKWK